jgi:hypothetical protein
MRMQSAIKKLAKKHGFSLKRCKRDLAWKHRSNLRAVITSATPSYHRALLRIEKRFKQASMIPAARHYG